MFKKLTTNFPPERGANIAPDRAVAILQKCASLADQHSFEWVVVDKPVDGSIFVFQLSPMEPLPEDGYGWLDEENSFRTFLGDREVEISSRNQGFGFGDKCTYMTRRRYKLGHSNLQLLHYVRVSDPAQQTTIHHHMIKTMPRDPATLRSLTEHAQPPAQIPSPYGSANVRRTSGDVPQARHASHRRRHKSRSTVQLRQVEDEEDPSGDELDGAVARAVALERYKRNHEFMDMIFSPHSTMDLVPPQLIGEDNPERIAALKAQREAVEQETEALIAGFAERTRSLQTPFESNPADRGSQVLR
ncbi:hypothetical protein DFJ77DRAFT_312738 [Powellomyces hirtus]|nr:hypothetical protein DFJ77DRAFT_312738 [Powellomyces hirtus]